MSLHQWTGTEVQTTMPEISSYLRSIPPKPSTVSPAPSCVCEEVICAQSFPESCLCANRAAQSCYAKCGGPQPMMKSCTAGALVAREVEPEASSDPEQVPELAKECTCEETMCIQMWPDSCWCANAAAQQCYKKCGGRKPVLQSCPPQPVDTPTIQVPNSTTSSTPTTLPKPINTHKICGGGRANILLCDPGETCITDPYTGGCGPACDALGICVKDKMCGGFTGLACDEEGQVCHDDPRDDCDPLNGGSDCGGFIERWILGPSYKLENNQLLVGIRRQWFFECHDYLMQ
ncbi:hypothetical protein IAQ61_009382, partial [Plenodomus lingam]|uniref:Uncharacterized protein n=1 Tax=Leptosphaeria maculans (strain JN3 / isolate v23.1.3 / race Av1-4-5-6-7-8) TaxID=985895 RepID=E4ZTZ0_LEPMJ